MGINKGMVDCCCHITLFRSNKQWGNYTLIGKDLQGILLSGKKKYRNLDRVVYFTLKKWEYIFLCAV